MKIAIGLIATIFGVLMVMYDIINNAANFIVFGLRTSDMLPIMTIPVPGLFTVVGAVLIVFGCVVCERGIKEK